MTNLPLDVVTETATTITLGWTPPPACRGYIFRANGKRSSTLDGTRSTVKFAKPGPYEVEPLGTLALGTWPPTAPPTGGTTHTAAPGQVLAAIAVSVPGDTVVCRGGAHPKLVLAKSFAAPGVTVKCEPGTWFAGIDTNGHSGYTFDSIESRLSVELYENNITPFYLHGASKRISLVGKFKLSGGYDGIKQYGLCEDFLLDGQGGEIFGFGGDGIHINGAIRTRLLAAFIHDPSPLVGPEHNDGIHAQDWDDLYIGPGILLSATNGPRSDVDSAGMFIKKEGGISGLGRKLVIDRVQMRSWQIGRGMQMLAADGNTIIYNPIIEDCGLPSSPKITLNSQGGTIECWGVDPDDVHFNSALGKANTVFH